ncbi:PREDICTED: F-box protein At5g42460-like [Camelina sativa]|uniref:F-box protein At5g42460-like n=1 Tax=Camelina sativa TaxID=90675 RepID=A0ABM1QZV6_CAMSA|nr:PREDICTED: F-box protein At5g42460-like [Camelina sativa]
MARHEIYNFKSNSWRVWDIIPSFYDISFKRGISLKGNTYFLAHKGQDFVICFDFTTEIFGPRLHLPLELNDDVILSCVREEQLAVLFVRCRGRYELAIWITTKIESNAMSWSKFFKVDIQLVRKSYFLSQFKVQSFFLDKEKKRAVVCGKGLHGRTSIVVGEDGCFEKLDLIDVFSSLTTTGYRKCCVFHIPSPPAPRIQGDESASRKAEVYVYRLPEFLNYHHYKKTRDLRWQDLSLFPRKLLLATHL